MRGAAKVASVPHNAMPRTHVQETARALLTLVKAVPQSARRRDGVATQRNSWQRIALTAGSIRNRLARPVHI